MKNRICTQCGNTLTEKARFCDSCGATVEMKSTEGNTAESFGEEFRKTVYEGKLFKCPNCGEVLNAFTSNCPTCGYELRETKAVSSVREFASKLEAIEAKRESTRENSLRDLYFGKTATKTDEQKISLIRSFAIPNTKEDLYEFLILASSNINTGMYDNGTYMRTDVQMAVSDAWRAKFEQAYEKAKLSFGDSAEFDKIQALYEKKHEEITKSKKKIKFEGIAWIGFMVVFLVVGYGVLLFMSSSDSRAVKEENKRLEVIVDEVYEALENDNYVLARAKATSLTFSGPNTTEADKASEKWDKTRIELFELIDVQSKVQSITPDDEDKIDLEKSKYTEDVSNGDKSDDLTSKNVIDNSSHVISNNKSVEVTVLANEYLDVKEFAWYISGDYLHCVIVLHNINNQYAVEYPAFRVTAYDADNKVMGTEEQVLSLIYPNQKFVCNQLLFEVDDEPAKITVTLLEPEDYNITVPSKLDYNTHEQMIGQNVSVNAESVTGEIYNPNFYKVDSAWVTVIFRNDAGEIVYGENSFIDQIPANGTAPFYIDVYTEIELPKQCEVYAYFW